MLSTTTTLIALAALINQAESYPFYKLVRTIDEARKAMVAAPYQKCNTPLGTIPEVQKCVKENFLKDHPKCEHCKSVTKGFELFGTMFFHNELTSFIDCCQELVGTSTLGAEQ